MSRRLLTCVALLALAACGKQGATPVTPDSDFTLQQAADSIPLAIGRDVRVGDVWMTFGDVAGDSRCPTRVQCVWAGDANVQIAVHPGCYKEGCKAASILLSLHTHLEPKSGSGWGRKVTLLSLTPYPDVPNGIDRSRYVAWVRVN
ncbi:MAG TPA: hypothetical protein VFV33_26400 [Gemmatimonadaceae bacterium]|nr:hypothetical protein [Gemmatimonadaceae bacterium]